GLRRLTARSPPAPLTGPPGPGPRGSPPRPAAAPPRPPPPVRLAAPPPLDAEMTLEDTDYGVRLMHGDTLVAEARPGCPEIDTPPPVDAAAAEQAAKAYVGLRDHPFPTCFGCGPEHPAGLRIFPAPVGGDGLLAAPWTPSADDPVFVWAALDCPSGFACIPPGSKSVLATMTAAVEAPIVSGETYVVTAWPISHDG